MRLAIEQAMKNPAYPFGAVIVNEITGEVMAEGTNSAALNPTHHGEMVAIDDYVKKHGNQDWARMTLYTTGEPCPMCMSAIAWCGIPRLYGPAPSRRYEHRESSRSVSVPKSWRQKRLSFIRPMR